MEKVALVGMLAKLISKVPGAAAQGRKLVNTKAWKKLVDIEDAIGTPLAHAGQSKPIGEILTKGYWQSVNPVKAVTTPGLAAMTAGTFYGGGKKIRDTAADLFGKDPNQGRDVGEMNLQPELLERMAELASGRETTEGGNVQPAVSLQDRLKGLDPNQRALVMGVLGLGGGILGSRAYGAATGKQSLLRDLGVGGVSAAALAGGDRLLNKESRLEAVMDGMYQGYKRD